MRATYFLALAGCAMAAPARVAVKTNAGANAKVGTKVDCNGDETAQRVEDTVGGDLADPVTAVDDASGGKVKTAGDV
ncbi:hypothetical protein NLG97_g8614 [Lecanicillium saksenae]|uniref:Uncharacterized protein n=1 Tax=Lecanicillium saksenae TaxID=468837 RepID=A0ACC1QL22_9HYPO|nr:hypothetical protein NLG97_g8614 [Lecanicillium saksenae]